MNNRQEHRGRMCQEEEEAAMLILHIRLYYLESFLHNNFIIPIFKSLDLLLSW